MADDSIYATELEMYLEAARRANWDALRGPQHLRMGRYRPQDALAQLKKLALERAATGPEAAPADDSPPQR